MSFLCLTKPFFAGGYFPDNESQKPRHDYEEDMLVLPNKGRVQCLLCGKDYVNKLKARKHIETMHKAPNDPSFQSKCQFCGKVFVTSTDADDCIATSLESSNFMIKSTEKRDPRGGHKTLVKRDSGRVVNRRKTYIPEIKRDARSRFIVNGLLLLSDRFSGLFFLQKWSEFALGIKF